MVMEKSIYMEEKKIMRKEEKVVVFKSYAEKRYEIAKAKQEGRDKVRARLSGMRDGIYQVMKGLGVYEEYQDWRRSPEGKKFLKECNQKYGSVR
jgi:hypothetical protein